MHFLGLFLSTPSVRRATHYDDSTCDNVDISIHALRAEGDSALHMQFGRREISIHALRAEGDALSFFFRKYLFQFLSTPSVRRATDCPPLQCSQCVYFYPRPPCGGRPE